MSRSAAFALVLIPIALPAAPPAAPRTDVHGDPLPPGAIARYGTARLRHGTAVRGLAFSPDGKLLASVSNSDATVRVWDAATGREVARADVGEDSCEVTWSPDGRAFVHHHGQALALVWDPKGGPPDKVPWGHNPRWAADALTFTPDGGLLAVGRAPGEVEVYRVAAGELTARLVVPGDTTGTHGLAFSPTGRHLLVVCAGKPGALRLWDVARARRVRTYTPPDGQTFRSAAFTPDGSKIVAATTQRLLVLDPDSEEELGGVDLDKEEEVHVARLSADGKELAAVTADGRVLRWGLNPGRGPDRPQGRPPERKVRAAAVSADARRAAVAADDGAIYVLDVRTGKVLAGAPDQQGLANPTFLPGPAGQVAATGADGAVLVWEARTGKPVRRLDPPAANARVAISADGRLAAFGQPDGGVFRVHDLATGVEKWRADGPEGSLEDLAFSRDGRRLIPVVNIEALGIWDTGSGKRVGSLEIGEVSVDLVVWSPDGRLVATGSHRSSPIHVWELATGRVRARLTTQKLADMAFSPDGKSLAAVVEHATAVVYDLATGEAAVRQDATEGGAAVAWAPDGSFLMAGGLDGRVFVWGPDGRLRHRLAGHEGAVIGVRVGPDGKTVLSTSADGTALLWDLAAAPPPADRVPPSPAARWDDLGSPDAARAYRALAALAGDPAAAVAGCRERIRPAKAPDATEVAKWVKDLDDPKYETRERATRALAGLGELSRPALEKRLAGGPSAEVGERIRALLSKHDGPLTDPVQLRGVRAVELLERVRTPAAVELLKEYAAGDPAGRLSREARAALDRLGVK